MPDAIVHHFPGGANKGGFGSPPQETAFDVRNLQR